MSGVAELQGRTGDSLRQREKAAQDYRRELMQQIEEQKARREREKREREQAEKRHEEEFMAYQKVLAEVRLRGDRAGASVPRKVEDEPASRNRAAVRY